MKADVGLDRADEVVGSGRFLHRPHLFGELGEIFVIHALERLEVAELLKREPHGDQNLLHLFCLRILKILSSRRHSKNTLKHKISSKFGKPIVLAKLLTRANSAKVVKPTLATQFPSRLF